MITKSKEKVQAVARDEETRKCFEMVIFNAFRPTPYRPDPAHMAFCRARRAMNREFLNWLRTRPDPDLIDDEVAASISLQRQLVRLTRAGGVV